MCKKIICYIYYKFNKYSIIFKIINYIKINYLYQYKNYFKIILNYSIFNNCVNSYFKYK